jgi:hypothetical protein
VTHLSEERDIPVRPEVVWRIIADTTRWPQFYATPHERLHLRSVEFLDGTLVDGPDARRRMHFLGVPSWDEQVSAWKPHEFLAWLGVRNPGLKYWQQQLELIPGDGYTTLRWDVYFSVSAPRAFKKWFQHTMEHIVLSSLERIERIAVEESKRAR